MIRPEAQALLWRWSGVAGSLALTALGLWVATRGGWLLAGLGAGFALFGLALAQDAWSRLRFDRGADGPGAVEITEGQIAFFGPDGGGFLALSDLASVGLITQAGQRMWQLRQSDGHSLSVPVDAAGADQLYTALTALPGVEGAKLLQALAGSQDIALVWQAASAQILPFVPQR